MKKPSDPINDTAAAWFARLLSPECSEHDRERFEQWCAADAAHADAFAQVAQCHEDAAALREDELMRAVARAARNTTLAPEGRSWPVRIARFAAAAALLIAVAGGTFWLTRGNRLEAERYATAIGEQRSVTLADGTRVRLDTDTAFSARYDDMARELVLEHGRIRIDVAKDPRRAFAVLSGRGIVRDIGTEFQVERYDDDVTVTLMSGLVSVALAEPAEAGGASLLAPGQQRRIGAHGGLGPPTSVDVARVSEWESGMLTFKNRRLGDLLDEMNRYSATKIRVADPSLALIQVSGVFRVGDQNSLLQALQAGWSIRSERVSANEIVLSSAR